MVQSFFALGADSNVMRSWTLLVLQGSECHISHTERTKLHRRVVYTLYAMPLGT